MPDTWPAIKMKKPTIAEIQKAMKMAGKDAGGWGVASVTYYRKVKRTGHWVTHRGHVEPPDFFKKYKGTWMKQNIAICENKP